MRAVVISSRVWLRNSRMWRVALLGVALTLFAGGEWIRSSASVDKPLPDGPGKAETQKLCSQCHDMDRSVSLRQDRAGWRRTIEKMLAFGAKASDQEFNAVLDYLRSEEHTSELQSLRHLVCR